MKSKFYLIFNSSDNFIPIVSVEAEKNVQPIKNCSKEIMYSDGPGLLKCINKDKT